MEKFRLRRFAGFLILSIIMFSCSNELHMTLPEGPQGSSAYDLWVEQVNNGSIKWDKNNVDINNFFLYLKGADGKDGQNGVDGKSAYQLWIEQVNSGLDNPHNTGTNWSKDKVTMQDFWYFLTGAKGQNGSTPIIGSNDNWFIDGKDTGIPAKGNDGSVVTIGNNGNWFIDGKDTTIPAFGKNGNDGQNGSNGQNGNDGQNGSNGSNGKSAYELWVEEVAKGLEDPHNLGTQWDKTKTSTTDFWEYLRGADGSDGKDGTPGETGEAGKDVIIVKGKSNVVAQYAAQEFSEYVRWTDGSVLYIVYGDQGSISPGAKVKGLPGVVDPTKVYTADANGEFFVPKEDLPLDKAVTDRFGTTAEVEYLKSTGVIVKEVSAPNTYVPSRMQIRLRLYMPDIKLDRNDIYMYTVVERKTDKTTDWSVIPSYLGDLNQKVIAYELSNMNDPNSYTSTSKKYYYTSTNISSTYSYNSVTRLVKASPYITNESYPWDGNDHYFNLVLESYYGEKPNANIVVKMAPVQYAPLVKNLRVYGYNSTLNIFSKMEGEFDFGVGNANIDQNLLFNTTLLKVPQTLPSGDTFDYYSPTTVSLSSISSTASFNTTLAVSTNKASNILNTTIASPNFEMQTPYVGSEFTVSSDNSYFKSIQRYSNKASSYGFIGNLEFDGTTGGLIINGIKNSSYNFPDIPVTQLP